MERDESLHHTKWECKYHLVWISKCRRKAPYGQLRDQSSSKSVDLGLGGGMIDEGLPCREVRPSRVFRGQEKAPMAEVGLILCPVSSLFIPAFFLRRVF